MLHGKMTVKVVGADTPTGRTITRDFPTRAEVLGQEAEIDLSTARRIGSGFVHFSAVVKTGPLTGRALSTLSTSIMILTPAQYARIEALVGGETQQTEATV